LKAKISYSEAAMEVTWNGQNTLTKSREEKAKKKENGTQPHTLAIQILTRRLSSHAKEEGEGATRRRQLHSGKGQPPTLRMNGVKK